MPHMPVVAQMPDGRFRLLWADPDAKIALEVIGSATAYVVKVKGEQEFTELQSALKKALETRIQGD